MSFLLPDAQEVQKNVVTSFCHFVHFFTSRQAGESWVAKHAGTFVLSIQEAHILARLKNEAQYGEAQGSQWRERAPTIIPSECFCCRLGGQRRCPVEDMPTARFMELMDKAEKREITPAEMQEFRKIGGEWINEKTAEFRRQNPAWRRLRARTIRRRPPGVSRSQHWLDEVKGFYGAYGVDESHPRVARVLAFIQKAETGGIL